MIKNSFNQVQKVIGLVQELEMKKRKIQYIADSFKGSKRSSNKDGFICVKLDDFFLFVVFDGVSSSNEAKQGVNMAIRFIKKNAGSYVAGAFFDIKKMFVDINNRLLESAYQKPYTTFCAAQIPLDSEKKVKIFGLGDSRVYAVSSQYIEQLSIDDILGKGSHIITKCLGAEEIFSDDIHEIIVEKKEDSFLLCTDGFYSVMNEFFADFFVTFNFKKTVRINKKIEQLLSGKNSDDATYIFVRTDYV